jgi:hypothetical protein
MARIPFTQKHRILREVYRHYIDFRDFCSREGKYFIEYGPITISLVDLQYGVSSLSNRKLEAFYYNVIRDMKQKDVAAIMDITTVSVGQYVEQAMLQLSERYFAEVTDEEIEAYIKIIPEDEEDYGIELTPEELAEERKRYLAGFDPGEIVEDQLIRVESGAYEAAFEDEANDERSDDAN